MLSIIIFIIILGVLIVVHEFGHFLAARRTGIRVDEFGIGYPPRAARLFRWHETIFTLNWIPFGGFVKIFGENPDEESLSGPESATSFARKSKPAQALVVAAGVIFNLLFAWFLISIGFMVGLPSPVGEGAAATRVENPRLVIVNIAEGSPAALAGLKVGDVIDAVSADSAVLSPNISEEVPTLSPEIVSFFIGEHEDSEISIAYSRGKEWGRVSVMPQEGIVSDKKAIGISMEMIGTLKLPPHQAIWEGAKTTALLTKATTISIAAFIFDAFRGQSDISQITGPVGIVGLVGDASRLGFIFILSFTAFISINLAVINLIPFPALDGGRLLFILIEAIKRSPINPRIANGLNAVGFVLLISLMIIVTANDILRLF